MSATWVRVLELDRLPVGGARTVKKAGKQLAVYRTEAGGVFAVDNRCPHEGYPLASGTVQGDLLTCAWHNWKFRLCDGECVLGGEAVRSYPVRLEDGGILVDVTDPPPERALPALYGGLAGAFDESDWGRIARTVERILEAGGTAGEVVGFAAEWAARRAPYGFDHGQAAAADALAIARRLPEEADLAAIQAVNLLVEEHVRRPVLPWPDPVDAGPDAGRLLRARIEAEDGAGAIAVLRGALAAGTSTHEVLGWLSAAATDHFLDFGHPHIYCVKAAELLAMIPARHAEAVLASLVTAIVTGTREDTLPYMRRYRETIGRRISPSPWNGERDGVRGDTWDVDALVEAILDGDLDEALGAVAAALDAGVEPPRVALGLCLAASHRILRFDAGLELRDDVSEGWLHVTHTLTHADAVRETLLRHPGADAIRGLFHSARFIQHMAPLDGPLTPPSPLEGERGKYGTPPPTGAADSSELETLLRVALSDRAVLPIFVAHHVKTTCAAGRLVAALGADAFFAVRADRDLPLRAAARFLAHPLHERRIARGAGVARTFVRTGHRQRALLGY